jgi:Sigma-70 region 2
MTRYVRLDRPVRPTVQTFFHPAVILRPLDRIYVMAMERATPDPQVTEAEKHILDWDRIYLDLAPRVYNYFRYRLGREHDVEDLTSRAFEKAWAAREQYRRDLAGFSTWLFKIAQNPCGRPLLCNCLIQSDDDSASGAAQLLALRRRLATVAPFSRYCDLGWAKESRARLGHRGNSIMRHSWVRVFLPKTAGGVD